MSDWSSAKESDRLFYASIFRANSADFGQPFEGSSGFLKWHVEAVTETSLDQTTTYIVAYQSSAGTVDDAWKALHDIEPKAIELAYTLLLPMSFRANRHLVLKLLGTLALDYKGGIKGNSNYTVHWIGNLADHRHITAYDYPVVAGSPELRRALQYYNAGLYMSDLGLYADACMNYVRAVEALMGQYEKSAQVKKLYQQQCAHLGLDFEQVRQLMSKIRNQWAVAHVTETPDKRRTLKKMPDATTENESREICRKVIAHLWEQARQDRKQVEKNYPFLYHSISFGDSPVPVPTLWADGGLGFGSSNLPTPRDVIHMFHAHLRIETSASM